MATITSTGQRITISGGGGLDVVWRNTILISTENQVAIEQARLAATAAARSRTN